jgi:hypothetical protein
MQNMALRLENQLASFLRRPITIENECDAKAILPNRRQP